MTNNKYKGETHLVIDGKKHTIDFDWNALAILKQTVTDKELEQVVSGENLELVADVLAVGLKKHHPEMTAQMIMDLSPPFVTAVQALEQALTYSYFGASDPETAAPQNRKKKRAAAKKK